MTLYPFIDPVSQSVSRSVGLLVNHLVNYQYHYGLFMHQRAGIVMIYIKSLFPIVAISDGKVIGDQPEYATVIPTSIIHPPTPANQCIGPGAYFGRVTV